MEGGIFDDGQRKIYSWHFDIYEHDQHAQLC